MSFRLIYPQQIFWGKFIERAWLQQRHLMNISCLIIIDFHKPSDDDVSECECRKCGRE